MGRSRKTGTSKESLSQGWAQDGTRRGVALGTGAMGRGGWQRSTGVTACRHLWALRRFGEAEVQSETIMEQKWGPWPHSPTFVVNILFFLFGLWHSLLLETGDGKGPWEPSSNWKLLVVASPSHQSGWFQPPHLGFSPYSTPTHPKDLLAHAITSLKSFLSGAFNASLGRALKVKTS